MTFLRLLSHARPYRRALALIAVLLVVQTGAVLALPWLGGRLAAGFFESAALDVDRVLIGIIALFGLRSVLAYLVGRQIVSTSARIVADLRQEVYERVQALPLGFFRARRQGDILASVVHDPEYLSGFLTGTLAGFAPNLLAVLGALVLMAAIDPLLAGLVVALMPLFYLCLRLIGRRLRPLAMQSRQAYADLVSIVEENLSMMPAIKGFTREEAEAMRHRAGAGHLAALHIREGRLSTALDVVIRFLAVVAMVVLLRLLGDRVTGGTMSLPDFVTFVLYAVFLTAPFAALAGVWGQTQQARGALARMAALMSEPPEAGRPGISAGAPAGISTDTPGSAVLAPVKGAIRFEGVHLAYPGRPSALKGVDLEIAAGETVALVGPNGAGKTTLINLLMRFDRPDRGRVLIDGTDIAGVDLASLRRQIAILSQSVLLFNATIRENIGYGREGVDDAAIEAAARRAQAHGFIADLPEGYATVIGERGVRLSGGQAQRVALARTLLKDPAILVLDEPTAMFDPDGEDAFIADARAAFADRTVILITHRPGSLALADRVVTLADGVVTKNARGVGP